MKSTTLASLLAALKARARSLGLTDGEWARRAGLRKETLSRLRQRSNCDLATLLALARVVGADLVVDDFRSGASAQEAHFPAEVDRDYEERLVELCRSGDLDARRWKLLGSPFFMGGLAVLAASAPHLDRRGLLELAEQLHPGVTEPAVFNLWLARSPVRPTRFFPLLEERCAHAA